MTCSLGEAKATKKHLERALEFEPDFTPMAKARMFNSNQHERLFVAPRIVGQLLAYKQHLKESSDILSGAELERSLRLQSWLYHTAEEELHDCLPDGFLGEKILLCKGGQVVRMREHTGADVSQLAASA